jgi:hypothetical protein
MTPTQNLIDIEKIFDIFESSNPNTAEEKLVGQHYTNIAFYTKMVNQAHTYPKTLGILKEIFTNIDDIGELEFMGTLMLISRAFRRIENIPLDNPTLKELVLESKIKEAYFKALNTAIKYFVEVEEYEKCIILQNHLNFFYKDC